MTGRGLRVKIYSTRQFTRRRSVIRRTNRRAFEPVSLRSLRLRSATMAIATCQRRRLECGQRAGPYARDFCACQAWKSISARQGRRRSVRFRHETEEGTPLETSSHFQGEKNMPRNMIKVLVLGLACLMPAAAAWADGAVYAMTDALGNNQVLVYHRAADGSLGGIPIQTTATGGGGSGLQLAGVDSLGSAGSI